MGLEPLPLKMMIGHGRAAVMVSAMSSTAFAATWLERSGKEFCEDGLVQSTFLIPSTAKKIATFMEECGIWDIKAGFP